MPSLTIPVTLISLFLPFISHPSLFQDSIFLLFPPPALFHPYPAFWLFICILLYLHPFVSISPLTISIHLAITPSHLYASITCQCCPSPTSLYQCSPLHWAPKAVCPFPSKDAVHPAELLPVLWVSLENCSYHFIIYCLWECFKLISCLTCWQCCCCWTLWMPQIYESNECQERLKPQQ